MTSRMEAAPDAAATDTAGVALLCMSVGGDPLAVPIDEVREIIQVGRLTPLPRVPAFVRGVTNLRGAVLPVIDLAARLGGTVSTLSRRSCIVLIQGRAAGAAGAERPAVGLLVDAVSEVLERRQAEVEPVPALGTRIDARFLQGITRGGGSLIGVLALDQVVDVAALTAAVAATDGRREALAA